MEGKISDDGMPRGGAAHRDTICEGIIRLAILRGRLKPALTLDELDALAVRVQLAVLFGE